MGLENDISRIAVMGNMINCKQIVSAELNLRY